MKSYRVVLRKTATDDLKSILRYVFEKSSNIETALSYTRRIRDRCGEIGYAPFSGVERNDIAEGLRMVVFERRVVIFYVVGDGLVRITNIVAGTRDYVALLRPGS